MKLDLLDTYNIRARLCPSIILLGPIALTIFFVLKKYILLLHQQFQFVYFLLLRIIFRFFRELLIKIELIGLTMQLNFLKLMILQLILFLSVDIIKNLLLLMTAFLFLMNPLTVLNLKNVAKVLLYI